MTSHLPMVYVIDDDSSIRSSLGRLLRLEGFRFAGFSSAEEFLNLKRLDRPACAISDIRMPGINGLDLQDLLEKRGLHVPIVFITGHGQIPMSVQAMKKGAVDFLPKPFSHEALLQAVKQAIEKDRDYLHQHRKHTRVQHCLNVLSERERQVLGGVIAGHLNKQIACKLGISEKTVKVHRANVMIKMKATSVAHLVRLSEVVGVVASKN